MNKFKKTIPLSVHLFIAVLLAFFINTSAKAQNPFQTELTCIPNSLAQFDMMIKYHLDKAITENQNQMIIVKNMKCFDVKSLPYSPTLRNLLQRVQYLSEKFEAENKEPSTHKEYVYLKKMNPLEFTNYNQNSAPSNDELVQTGIRIPLSRVRHSIKPLLKPELKVLAFHGVSFIILAMTPPSFTKWNAPFTTVLIRDGAENFRNSRRSPPVFDKDNFLTNYIAHPYAGSYYYNILRSSGYSAGSGLAFSIFQSTIGWEYGLEALFEHPSIQDLIATPLIGSVLGEGIHQLTRYFIEHGKMNVGKKILITILNPAWVMNNGFH